MFTISMPYRVSKAGSRYKISDQYGITYWTASYRKFSYEDFAVAGDADEFYLFDINEEPTTKNIELYLDRLTALHNYQKQPTIVKQRDIAS